MKRLLAGYLIFIGILAHVAAAAAVAWALAHYDLTPRQFLVQGAKRLGADAPWVVRVLSPAPAYAGHAMDGRVRPQHPRIVLHALLSRHRSDPARAFEARAAAYKHRAIAAPPPCIDGGLLGHTVCWLVTGNAKAGRRALADLRHFQVTTPSASGRYGNGWELALAFDLLSLNPALTPADRDLVNLKLERSLRDDLVLLDGDSASLWHGRATLAAEAWLCAIELNPLSQVHRKLIRRAQGHFLDTMTALGLVEAWPEGYNYWINNRAFLIALAGSAYLNGLDNSRNAQGIRRILRRVGLWTVYATRPDNRIEGYGDEGSRIDLKDETRRVIDIITQLTGDHALSSYSRYLGRLHGRESYYGAYRWGFWLFNDPNVAPLTSLKPGTLQGLGRILPKADIFGRGAMNMAYIRSGWGPDDTFISFHAGDIFTHHGHYDAGHFTIFKGAPLAINSSTYGGYISPNRLDYSIRTVAKNSLLILRPGERVQPNRFFKHNVADGGQRIVLPTGSAIRSVQDWRDNLHKGLHLEGGRLLHFENEKGHYAYIAADLTKAYNTPEHDEGGSGGKVTRVRRDMLYLYQEDRLIVFDDVTATHASYTKKWLLHTVAKPQVRGLRLLKGHPDNGILQSSSREAIIHNGRGYLQLWSVYPRDAVMRLVGGTDYQFYVEADGDDHTLNGKNFRKGARFAPWFDIGLWRIELQPAHPRKRDHFLVVLSPSLGSPRRAPSMPLKTNSANTWGVAEPDSLIIFTRIAKEQRLEFAIPGTQTQLYVLGLPPNANVTLAIGDRRLRRRSSDSGIVAAMIPTHGARSVTLTWR